MTDTQDRIRAVQEQIEELRAEDNKLTWSAVPVKHIDDREKQVKVTIEFSAHRVDDVRRALADFINDGD